MGLRTALNEGGVAVVLSHLVAFDGGVAFGGSALRPRLGGLLRFARAANGDLLLLTKPKASLVTFLALSPLQRQPSPGGDYEPEHSASRPQ
jgi:hypothetical protein